MNEERREMKEPEQIDLIQNDNPICPHCGDENQDTWELEADFDTLECRQCGNRYIYERIKSITVPVENMMVAFRVAGLLKSITGQSFTFAPGSCFLIFRLVINIPTGIRINPKIKKIGRMI